MTDSRVTFEIILMAEDRGFQYPILVSQGEALTDEGNKGWYACDIGEDGGNGLPLWPYECIFKYDKEGSGLELRAKWKCTDLDRAHP